TINHSGNYGFMVSAVDAELTPGSLIDKFRIKIWDKDDGDNVIYDNNIFADETAEAATEIGGGSIVIHSVKNKSAQILQDNLVDKENIGLQVYPNPFNNKVFFEFNSQETTHARIDLFDATGRLVKTVFNNPVIKGIPYKIEFSSEINRDCYYVYRMILGEEIFNGKILHNK
ncbi:MAG: T9SS type A sorting domain-containing protein, partial [Prolixibacteraceae bacterium]|nr:T9SS type A sorting domain-containing protein [Prolixibacteraceae bacterium]